MMLRHRPSDRVQGHVAILRTYCMTKWYIFRAGPRYDKLSFKNRRTIDPQT